LGVVEKPEFETARTVGITISQSIVFRADKPIE